MRAWQVTRWGEPDEMVLADIPVPEPGSNAVRIRNRAAALNFFDILQIQGKYQVKPAFPFTPGAEVAGVVDAVGADVKHVQPGDEVMALVHDGGYAEYSVAEAHRTFLLLAGMGFPEAAAFPVAYHTTYFALHRRAMLVRNEWLLVHAGASGVGLAAIQMGKAFGARVLATAGSSRKLEVCRQHGADLAVNYQDSAWVEQVKQATGGPGADVIYDPVGGDIFDLSTRCLASGGRVLVIGFASGRIPTVQVNRILLKNISVVGVHWGQYVRDRPEFLAQAHDALAAMYLSRQLRPLVSKVFSLEEAPEALHLLAARQVTGKAVLALPG